MLSVWAVQGVAIPMHVFKLNYMQAQSIRCSRIFQIFACHTAKDYKIHWPFCNDTIILSLGRKEMFYLTTHSTHFNMVMDHSDIERSNLLPPLHWLIFPISSKGSFMHHPTDRIEHATAFVTPVVEHWLEREIAQWVYHEGSIQ